MNPGTIHRRIWKAPNPSATTIVSASMPPSLLSGASSVSRSGISSRTATAAQAQEQLTQALERDRTLFEYVEQDWANEEWIRGGYGAHLGPGVWTAYGDQLRAPHGLVQSLQRGSHKPNR